MKINPLIINQSTQSNSVSGSNQRTPSFESHLFDEDQPLNQQAMIQLGIEAHRKSELHFKNQNPQQAQLRTEPVSEMHKDKPKLSPAECLEPTNMPFNEENNTHPLANQLSPTHQKTVEQELFIAINKILDAIVPGETKQEPVMNACKEAKPLTRETSPQVLSVQHKHFHIFFDQGAIELGLNTKTLKDVEPRELIRSIKAMLAEKGITLRQLIINGVHQ